MPVTTDTVLTSGDITAAGIKVNYQLYTLTATADDQVTFTLPFTYNEGDSISVIADGITYAKGNDFIVSGTTLTLGSAMPALDLGDVIQVNG